MAKNNAFTLTEVLLATAIVGIIAGLVLPITISHYQDRNFEQLYSRNIQAISNAIDTLIVSENTDFHNTSMYKASAPSNYNDSSGKFMKKYMKISKDCGNSNRDCFANSYYKYENHRKVIYNPRFVGACASLKNGASICLEPQIGNDGVKGTIDLNGKKGPNVWNKDLRTFSLSPRQIRAALSRSTAGVNYTEAPNWNLGTTGDDGTTDFEDDPCAEIDSLACCQNRPINDPGDPCCTLYNEIRLTRSECLVPSDEEEGGELASCRTGEKIDGEWRTLFMECKNIPPRQQWFPGGSMGSNSTGVWVWAIWNPFFRGACDYYSPDLGSSDGINNGMYRCYRQGDGTCYVETKPFRDTSCDD